MHLRDNAAAYFFNLPNRWVWRASQQSPKLTTQENVRRTLKLLKGFPSLRKCPDKCLGTKQCLATGPLSMGKGETFSSAIAWISALHSELSGLTGLYHVLKHWKSCVYADFLGKYEFYLPHTTHIPILPGHNMKFGSLYFTQQHLIKMTNLSSLCSLLTTYKRSLIQTAERVDPTRQNSTINMMQ